MVTLCVRTTPQGYYAIDYVGLRLVGLQTAFWLFTGPNNAYILGLQMAFWLFVGQRG